MPEKHLLKRKVNDPIEQKELLKARQVISPDEIKRLAANVFSTAKSKIISRKGKRRHARKTAMFLCCKLCVSRHSLTKIAKLFSVSLGGLTKMRDDMKRNPDPTVLQFVLSKLRP